MANPLGITRRPVDRRSFMKSGLLASGVATVGVGLLANGNSAGAQDRDVDGRLDAGDVAILRFLAAAELIEAISGHSMRNWVVSAIVCPSR
jgi:hypothetical protein